MEEKSQLWFACSPCIQVSFWFKQGEGREKKGKKRRNRGMETSLGLCMESMDLLVSKPSLLSLCLCLG